MTMNTINMNTTNMNLMQDENNRSAHYIQILNLNVRQFVTHENLHYYILKRKYLRLKFFIFKN